MKIQIWGTPKCPDTRKAVMFFEERSIKYQLIDLTEKNSPKGELKNLSAAVGDLNALIDRECKFNCGNGNNIREK